MASKRDSLAEFASTLLATTNDRVPSQPRIAVEPVFCATCLGTEGPYRFEPIGVNDAIVRVCAKCAGEAVPEPEDDEDLPDDVPLTYIQCRRDRLRKANRCINGPLDDRPGRNGVVHGPPVRGGRCQRCVDAMGRNR